jgi:hypothetical protein
MAKERWVLDTQDDLNFCANLAVKIKPLPSYGVLYTDILRVLDIYPELRELNKAGIRNERFYEAINTEELPPRQFDNSNKLLGRALERIPFWCSGLSARATSNSLPDGLPCMFHTLMVLGFLMLTVMTTLILLTLSSLWSLAIVTLMDEAIRRQLDNGISFSLAD